MSSTTRIVNTPKPVRPMVRSPTSNPRMPKGAGKDLKRLPKMTAATACSTTNSPRVRITALISDLPSTGRTTTRSRTAPSTRPLSSAAAKPSHQEWPASISDSAMNVVSIAIGACAKFTMRVERQIITRARAKAA